MFPFKFEDKEYTKCTNFGCPECFWCGTKYSVSDTEGWGLCNEACPIQEYGKRHFFFDSDFTSIHDKQIFHCNFKYI